MIVGQHSPRLLYFTYADLPQFPLLYITLLYKIDNRIENYNKSRERGRKVGKERWEEEEGRQCIWVGSVSG